MPQIYPKKVASFSSEDKEFPASNLLKSSSFNKWRSEKGGTSQEVVELDFGEPVEISRLDIGNNGSAFIEVLARRSASPADPMVFLPCSSFMSPADAKNETNLTRVRVFSGDQLYEVAAKQKWDIFRLVCTQPFNKTLPYGISFISFHTPSPKHSQTASELKESTGASSSTDEKNEGESSAFRPGALFQASRNTQPVSEAPKLAITVAEKLRAAQQAVKINLPKTSPTPTETGNPVAKSSNLASGSDPTSKGVTTSSNPASTSTGTSSSKSESHVNPDNNAGEATTSSNQRPSSRHDAKTNGAGKRGPLSGVVFTLSGYQNPLRNELRQKALQLGAQYRQNWEPDCTHLICAFANTPKFKQVMTQGFIVSGKWIEKCHNLKCRVDWRPFRVGRAPSPPSNRGSVPIVQSSESESDSESSSKSAAKGKLNKRSRNKEDDDWVPDAEGSDSGDSEEPDSETGEDEEDTGEEEDDDEDDVNEDEVKSKKRKRNSKARGTNKRQPVNKSPSEARSPPVKRSKPANPEDEDTDDEIQRVMNPSPSNDPTSTKPGTSDTEESHGQTLPELPNLFEDKHFFVHNKAMPTDEERLIQRLIVAFAGTLHQYMHPDVQFVVTRSAWNEEFDAALVDNANLIFVRPDWIFACDEQAKRVPFQKYLVVG